MSAYSDAVLADTPLRYYRLDEAVGATVASDLGSQAQSGTYNAGVTLGIPGLILSDADTALACPGNGPAVTLPSTGLPTGNPAWSLEAWFRPAVADTDAGYHAIIGMGQYSYLEMAVMYLHASGLIFSPSGNDTDHTLAPVVAGSIYHGVITSDGATARVFLNGLFATSKSLSQALNLTENGARIGANPTASQDYLSGSVDEVAIYNYALSAARIQAHYLAGVTLYGAGVSLGVGSGVALRPGQHGPMLGEIVRSDGLLAATASASASIGGTIYG